MLYKINGYVPVTIEDNILTFAYYPRSMQRLNLRVTQLVIDSFALLPSDHSNAMCLNSFV